MRPVKSSVDLVRKMPLTLAVILVHTGVFVFCQRFAGVPEGPQWTATLLRMGALFSPLTLEKEWYRLFTHLFLHGSVLHLAVNVYALLYTGVTIETKVGTTKYAAVFVLCAVAAALSGMYWNLFTVGVGSSGAVAGLFGFYLMYNIFLGGANPRPTIVLLLHLTAFAAINLFFPVQVYADYAALYGGFLMGVMTGLLSFARRKEVKVSAVRAEYAMAAFLVLMFLMMPGYQVRYFRFFEHMVAAEDTTRYLLKEKLTDDDMRTFIRNYHHWEEVETRLVSQKDLPADLSTDTFRLRRYIALRKRENLLKKTVVQREAYVYLDSVEELHSIMRRYMDLEYELWSLIRPGPSHDSLLQSRMVTIHYDSLGQVVQQPAGGWYRRVILDSLGRWDGPFREFDDQGRLRIKGSYRKNKKHGVFLYYFEDGKCAEAGRYVDDRRFGKWQTFHANGRIASESYYNHGHFVSAVWDPFGNQLVVDGNGREIRLHSNGVVAVSGEYRHGQKEGVWYGWYENGEMHFEETYQNGNLVSGKSRSPDGKTFLYDASSYYPLPEGGLQNYRDYLKREARAFQTDDKGHVKLSFRVAQEGTIFDLMIDQGATPALDTKAREIVLKGPRWLPAREHGYRYRDARAHVQVEFY